jgi:hypothetical protein
MLGVSPWVWVVVIVVAFIVLRARALYTRFRRMCRGVREELTQYLQSRYPDAQVLREEKDNLVVRMPGGEERVWEMEDVYVEVARLPGMGADPQDRSRVYEQAVRVLFPPEPITGPLQLEAHGASIKPRLVRAQDGGEPLPDGAVRTTVPGLPLAEVYVLDRPGDMRYLTERDASDLGLDPEELRRVALENLRKQFPREMVATALEGEGSAVQLNDSFDAARLLLVPECLEPGQEVLALAPHRDMLVLMPAELAEDPENLNEGMKLLGCENHPPLLDRPVRVTPEGFQLV